MSFRNYRLPSTYLGKYLKRHVSVHSRTVNMLKGFKHCFNLHESSLISFVYQSGETAVGKSLS